MDKNFKKNLISALNNLTPSEREECRRAEEKGEVDMARDMMKDFDKLF